MYTSSPQPGLGELQQDFVHPGTCWRLITLEAKHPENWKGSEGTDRLWGQKILGADNSSNRQEQGTYRMVPEKMVWP